MIKLQNDNKKDKGLIPGNYNLLPLRGKENALVAISPNREYRVRVGLPGGCEKEFTISQSNVGISVASSSDTGTLSILDHYYTLHVPSNMIVGSMNLPVPLFYGRPPALRRSYSYS